MKNPLTSFTLLFGIFISTPCYSADKYGLEFITLTSHVQSQRDAPVYLYINKLDDDGTHVFTPGIEFYYEKSLTTPIAKSESIRFTAGILKDSIEHNFFYLGVLGNYDLYQTEKLKIEAHIGPGLIARESWRSVPGYNPENPLKESDKFLPGYEYQVVPLVELDLIVPITKRSEFIWSIFPGIPYVLMQSVGIRWSL